MAAFEELFQKYDKRVITIAAHYMQGSEEAKDIYQEVFILVYHGIARFQFRSEFSTWLHRITVNACLSHITKHKKHRHSWLDENVRAEEGLPQTMKGSLQAEEEADQMALGSEVVTHVGEVLETLSAKQRMVFTLRHMEGHTLREIAVMMKCPLGTVKSHLFEATRRMRVKLKDLNY